jgi:hypothetical protein
VQLWYNTSYARQRYFLVMEVGMHPLIRGSVDAFIASGGIPTRGHGVRHVGILVGTSLHLHFSENTLGMRLGPHGLSYRLCGLVLRFHTHKEE